MVAADLALSLAGYGLGTLGGVLVFVELFQLPNYVEYKQNMGTYNLQYSPTEAREYTWAGRVGAILIALAFAFQFVATLL